MSLFILNKSFAAISKKRCQKKSRESSSHNLRVMQLLSNPSFGAENHSTKLAGDFSSSLILKHSYHLKTNKQNVKLRFSRRAPPIACYVFEEQFCSANKHALAMHRVKDKKASCTCKDVVLLF